MMTRHVATFASAALAGLAPFATLSAQSFKDVLPSRTIFYAAMPDIPVTLEEAKQTPLLRMWAEEEVQDFLRDGIQFLQEQYEQGLAQGKEMHANGQLPVDPEILTKLRVESLGIGITQLDLVMGEFEPVPKLGIALHVDFGESAPHWRQLIDMGLQVLVGETRGELALQQTKIGEADVMSLTSTEMPDFPMGLHLGFVGDSLLVTTLEDDLKGMVARLTNPGQGLSAQANFVAAFRNINSQGAELETYFDLQPMLDFLIGALQLAAENGELPPEVDVQGIERAIDALGLRSILAIAATTSYVGGEVVTDSFTYAPAPTRKGLLGAAAKEMTLDFLPWVPKDAVSFSAGTWEPMAIHDGIMAAIAAYSPDVAEMVQSQLGQIQEQVGISLKDDLFGAFGDHYITWSMPMAGLGSTPEAAYLFKVKDGDRLVNVIRTIAQMSGGNLEFKEVNRRGIQAYQLYMNFELPPEMNMPFNPLETIVPTFTFHKGYLVAAMNTGDVKRAIKRMDREDVEPSGDIRGNAQFQAQMEKLPETGLTSVSFTDWQANFESSYQAIAGLLPLAPIPPEVPIDLTLLPDSQTMTQHLFGGLSYSVSTGQGFQTRMISPWGPETVVPIVAIALGAGIGFAMAAPARFR